MNKLDVIYLDEDKESLWIENGVDENDPLWGLKLANSSLRFKQASVEYAPACTSEGKLPRGFKEDVLLLDVSHTQATDLQQRYGIVCQPTRGLSACPLAARGQGGRHYLTIGEANSWHELLLPVQGLPSNAIVINDRYLMSGDRDLAVENIRQILDELLPRGGMEEIEYHVLIVFDEQSMSRNDLNALATKLNKCKQRSLKRPYDIRMEMLAINHNTPGRADTHDRRILSNCFFIEATHQLVAFGGSGRELCSQTIDVARAYSYGLHDHSDLPHKAMGEMARQLRTLILGAMKAEQPEDVCKVWVNGRSMGIGDISNRLIMT